MRSQEQFWAGECGDEHIERNRSGLLASDLSFISGVLIHINPDMLPAAYDRHYEASSRFVLIAEYYNPVPMEIPYRGHSERMYKRDFAGELLDRHTDLRLIDYGFAYRRDPVFPQDDITWFLMEKTGLANGRAAPD